MTRPRQATLTVLGAGVLAFGAAAPAAAIPAAGILEPTVLAIFDTDRPADVRFLEITGLASQERIAAIDVRPADGLLYGVGVTTGATDALRLYRIDGATGTATAIGAGGVSATTGAHYDVDFNPVPDRLRVINGGDANLRLNPNSGVLAGLDTSLSPAGTGTGALAYDRPDTDPATLTTAYVLRPDIDALALLGGIDSAPSPNGGVLTTVGGLGADVGATASFDIAADGTAFSVSGTRLSTVALTTGALTAKGTLPVPLDALAVGAPVTPPVPVTQPAPTTTMVTVTPPDKTAPGYLLQALATTRQATLRKGLTLRFACSERCTAKATLSLGKTTVGAASATPADPGNGKLKLKLSKTGAAKLKASLAKKPSVSVKLTLTLTDQARNARTVTKTFRAKR
ncbi:MAG: DUF4394 domain-containing protein [Solirubrobacteraceae bacterium]|nr:DUF4394 domain-containing protein [Solirubrobacteraceae bacterium]